MYDNEDEFRYSREQADPPESNLWSHAMVPYDSESTHDAASALWTPHAYQCNTSDPELEHEPNTEPEMQLFYPPVQPLSPLPPPVAHTYAHPEHTETHALLIPYGAQDTEESEDGRGWYMRCVDIGVHAQRGVNAVIPVAVVCLILGVWMHSDTIVLFGGGLCFIAVLMCIPHSTIVLIVFFLVYLWTSFGSKAYYIIRHTAIVNSTIMHG